ncbi:MAG TPA: hypothetical protein VMU55_09575 [Solirubrobacteraceae bacterium]|nr:hypothetical protein [Solirubrobacteraceae bacterium]
MADRSRGVLGRASRGLVAEIDEQLSELDSKLAPHEHVVAERERLRAARAVLMGESPPPQTPRISQDDLIGYLIEHPGSRASAAAKFFGVPLTTVSAHFYRGKLTTFVSRGKGWYVRPQAAKAYAERTGK